MVDNKGMGEWDGVERRKGNVSEEVSTLASGVATLATSVTALRKDIAQVDTKRKLNLLWLLPIILLVIYGLFEQRQFREVADRDHKQTLAMAVGVCAMQNVIRIEIGNFLAEAQNQGVFKQPGDSSQALQANEARQVFLTEARQKFTLVPCEALVAGEEVRIQLQYPPQVSVTTP